LVVGKPYDEQIIVDVLRDINFNEYFLNISKEDFIDCFFN
jgi:hypothetical protein